MCSPSHCFSAAVSAAVAEATKPDPESYVQIRAVFRFECSDSGVQIQVLRFGYPDSGIQIRVFIFWY